MYAKVFVSTIAAVVFVATSALAQTVGMGATKRGYTSQAGAAISKVVSLKAGLQMRVQPFGGSSAYVPQVSAGTLEFGLANEIEANAAATGTGIYKGRKQPGLRVGALLQPFRVAIYTRKDSGIRSIRDLRGKRVPSGWTSQKIIGVLMNGELANAGMTYDDVVKVPAANVVAGANDFAAGKADVFFFVFGAGKVRETNAKVGGIRVVPIDPSPEAVARMRKFVGPSYPLEVKPSKANVGVDKPLHVMAYDYLMLTSDKVSDDVVYRVVKTMHDNKKALVAAFGAMRLFDPGRMTKTIPGVSYHPGAIRFYREIGQWPPK